MLIILISLILCSGCSPSRRLARLVKMHPELQLADTLLVTDTVVVPQAEADTAFPLDHLHDTVLLQKDRLEVFIRKVHDTLYIRGKCKPDTVVIRKKIPVTKIIIAKPQSVWWLWGVVCLLIVMVFVLILKK